MHPGLTGTAEHTVTDADSAAALGSGDVEVLATPRVLALIEQATVAAVAAALPPESTSVGAHIELDHLRPTRSGAKVRAEAELKSVDGRRLTFVGRVWEGNTVVATATVLRVLVDRATFGS